MLSLYLNWFLLEHSFHLEKRKKVQLSSFQTLLFQCLFVCCCKSHLFLPANENDPLFNRGKFQYNLLLFKSCLNLFSQILTLRMHTVSTRLPKLNYSSPKQQLFLSTLLPCSNVAHKHVWCMKHNIFESYMTSLILISHLSQQ